MKWVLDMSLYPLSFPVGCPHISSQVVYLPNSVTLSLAHVLLWPMVSGQG